MRDRIVLQEAQYLEISNRVYDDESNPYYLSYMYAPLPHIDVKIYKDDDTFFTLRFDYENGLLKIDGDGFSLKIRITENTKEEREKGKEVLLQAVDVEVKNKAVERVLAGRIEESSPRWVFLCSVFLNINEYVLLYGNRVFAVEEKLAKKSETKHKYEYLKRDGDKVRLYKCYTLTKSWKRMKPLKKPEIACPAWGVRGHFRNYKSGKTVWINAYVKGKDKENYKGKEYLLCPTEAK